MNAIDLGRLGPLKNSHEPRNDHRADWCGAHAARPKTPSPRSRGVAEEEIKNDIPKEDEDEAGENPELDDAEPGHDADATN